MILTTISNNQISRKMAEFYMYFHDSERHLSQLMVVNVGKILEFSIEINL